MEVRAQHRWRFQVRDGMREESCGVVIGIFQKPKAWRHFQVEVAA